MDEYIYPAWARADNEWVRDMLNTWRKSGKPYLCFPWINFKVHTLESCPFWMYLYYGAARTDIPDLAGRIEFRLQVVQYSEERFQASSDICLVREKDDGTAWFRCDRYQEILKPDRSRLSLNDFEHVYGKNLASTLRNSIPHVKCLTALRIIHNYHLQTS